MILIIRQFILILSAFTLVACQPGDERVEITQTRELGDFKPKPKLNLSFRDRVGIEEKKTETSSMNSVSFFVKLTGPKATVDAEMDNFDSFCRSLKIGEGNPPFEWVKPETWNEEEQSTMRVANFSFGKNLEGECYFTVLPGGGGGLVANVNRWRKQMNLADLSKEEVDSLANREFLFGQGKYIELEGDFKSVGSTEVRKNYKLAGIILSELPMNFEK